MLTNNRIAHTFRIFIDRKDFERFIETIRHLERLTEDLKRTTRLNRRDTELEQWAKNRGLNL